jgi:hypothetical protein
MPRSKISISKMFGVSAEGLGMTFQNAFDNPVHGTNLKQPLSKTIRGINRKIHEAICACDDVRRAFPGLGRAMGVAEGSCICTIAYLEELAQRIEEVESKEGTK